MLETGQLLAGGFFIGLLASFWSRVRTAGTLAASRLVVRADLEDRAADAVTFYCWRHFRRSRYGGARRYCAFKAFVRPLARHQDIAYEAVGKEPLVFWHGWFPVVLQYNLPPPNGTTLGAYPVAVTFLRGTLDIDELVAVAVDEVNAVRHGGDGANRRFRVERVTGFHRAGDPGNSQSNPHLANSGPPSVASDEEYRPDRRLLRWTPGDIGVPVAGGDPLDPLALTPEVRRLVEDGRRWLASERWYKAKRIPWRMGWLLYGVPGTGKSSFVRAVTQSLDLPVFAFDLTTMTNRCLTREWKAALASAPCVTLFEDIDAVFDGRVNVSDGEDGGGVTFDCLLNCLSGVGDSSGVLTVVTTNRVDKLDDALGRPDLGRGGFSTRPGRIDRAVEMPVLTEDGRRHVAARILADCPVEIDAAVARGDGMSGAQFEDLCSRVALDHYWGEPKQREGE